MVETSHCKKCGRNEAYAGGVCATCIVQHRSNMAKRPERRFSVPDSVKRRRKSSKRRGYLTNDINDFL